MQKGLCGNGDPRQRDPMVGRVGLYGEGDLTAGGPNGEGNLTAGRQKTQW